MDKSGYRTTAFPIKYLPLNITFVDNAICAFAYFSSKFVYGHRPESINRPCMAIIDNLFGNMAILVEPTPVDGGHKAHDSHLHGA